MPDENIPPPATQVVAFEPISTEVALDRAAPRMVQPMGSEFVVWHPWGGGDHRPLPH